MPIDTERVDFVQIAVPEQKTQTDKHPGKVTGKYGDARDEVRMLKHLW
jgi:hypothetical protein